MTQSVCRRNATLSCALFALAVLLPARTASAKRNDDTITMKNGDRFTGEIKKLDHGILYFKSSYMLESVQLDWTQVDMLESKASFLVALQNGKRYTGHIAKAGGKESTAQEVQLDTEGGELRVAQPDVISIQRNKN